MKTTQLGATALEISEIGFGGIPIIPLPREEAVSVVKHCFDLGITFFDTANMYPTSEEKLGIALKSISDSAKEAGSNSSKLRSRGSVMWRQCIAIRAPIRFSNALTPIMACSVHLKWDI